MDEKLVHAEGLSFGNRVLMAHMALVGAMHLLVDRTRSLCQAGTLLVVLGRILRTQALVTSFSLLAFNVVSQAFVRALPFRTQLFHPLWNF